ncbi:MAG: GNAT family N-acetyltransferase [Gammaproteobacteria bacterium]|nr:GNAT family N-acetyltransferase [Gammaproteobacteria bacterium]MCW8988056.1 GNAT family N-acetyltransferase [Gammaproteobacteria bacterium]MCW9030608.1 GNAT family N-acetyltransferase [Gammaproteobacteria bacterium]
MSITIKTIESLHRISATEWNTLAGNDFPFSRYEFLIALEDHGAVGKEFGWLPHFFLAYDNEMLVGALPVYIKFNSYGEFVFDWAWADAYQQNNLRYYPKLVTSIPYTPATGPRLLIQDDARYNEIANTLVSAVLLFAEKSNISSYHCLFTNNKDTDYFSNNPNFMMRLGCQFHWTNNHYKSFSDYLTYLTSKKRKQIKRERRIVKEQDIEFEILNGHEASDHHWDIYHQFYESTFERKSGMPTLSNSFFKEIAKTMPDNIVLVLAKYQENYVASAFNLKGTDTLYGRHWGCSENFDNLHFEACYYQGLEYCIKHNLNYFEPGAQGEHKIARGFMPTKTWSAHWIAHPQFRESIAHFLNHETKGMLHYIDELNEHSPFKEKL